MMKGIYFYINGDTYDVSSGIVKKINMQVEALKRNNVDVEVVSVNQSGKIYKFIRRLPLLSCYNRKVRSTLLKSGIENVDFIYIRKDFFDAKFVLLCKEIKSRNPNVKLIVEIPTYPYDNEWCRLIDKPLLIKEKLNRHKLCGYVDRFITLSDDNEIFGVKTIKIQNGIDVNIMNKKTDNKNTRGIINLIGVAVLTFWHGYDRIVNGLEEYYKSKDRTEQIVFNIVGEGVELSHLKKIVKSKGLEDHIIFHGKQHGAELDDLFNKSDIAIGSLGIHRLGLTKVSTLKAKEYCARGIPFIKAYVEKDFDGKGLDFYLNFPSDESNININEILEFYNKLVSNYGVNEVRDRMRSFAENNLTWVIQVRPIVEYIKSE